MWKRYGFIAMLITFIIGGATSARAELWADTYGVGARPNAMGGAFTAVADDYMATYYNMAGLGQIKQDQIGLEAMYYQPDIKVTSLSSGRPVRIANSDGSVRADPADDSEGNDMVFYTPVVGVAIGAKRILDPLLGPIINMFLPDLQIPNTTIGLVAGITETANNALRVRALPPDEPHQVYIGDQANQVLVRVGMGTELIEDLAYVGLGANIMPTVTGTTLYAYNYRFTEYVQMQGRIHVEIFYSPQFGLLLTPMDKKLKLGYAYSGYSAVETGTLTVPATIDMLGSPLTLTILGEFVAAYTPERHRIGMSYNLFDTLLVSCDLVRKMWSKYEYCDAEKFLYNETNRVLYDISGAIPTDPGFKDVTDVHLGAELKLGELLTARCGLAYMPNPVPDQSGKITNYIGYDTTVLSVGGSINWENPKMEIIGAIRYFMYDGYTVDKTGCSGITWAPQESYKVEDATAFSVSAGLKWWF